MALFDWSAGDCPSRPFHVRSPTVLCGMQPRPKWGRIFLLILRDRPYLVGCPGLSRPGPGVIQSAYLHSRN